MYVSNHVGSLSSTAAAAAVVDRLEDRPRGARRRGRGEGRRGGEERPEELVHCRGTSFRQLHCSGRALNCSAQTSLARPLRCSRRSEDGTQAAHTARPGDARYGLPFV